MAVCIIAVVMHIATCDAQVNLVINPGFEEVNSCPDNAGQLNYAVGWSTPLIGGAGNPELYHTCCTQPSMCGIPLNCNNYSFQFSHSGEGYAGIDVLFSYYIDDWREYIQTKLTGKLIAGHTYCVRLYCSLSDQCRSYITSLGIYFDNGDVSPPSPHGLAPVSPQILNTLQPLSDTINWMEIEGSFVATGTEEYLTIGNFSPDSTSGIGFFGTPSSWVSYYYIDDVSVIDINQPAFAGNDTFIHPGDSAFIGRTPEVGLNDDCIWSVNGSPIDTIAGMWVKPDSTTTYFLEQTICGNVSYDTVTIY
ncbi:MAG: hypothetical protein KKD31_14195, partial [Bacteroidetes bacterium]|nr:hypothetical protein [Bacteroidota bacterium]